jgi:hypothetical protein
MFNLIIWLLSKLTNPAYRNELIGDLEEEYNQRLQENNHARAWVLKQAIQLSYTILDLSIYHIF